jgi:peptidoglycan/LPS O-acetylase OafA/YrhL
MKTSSELAPPAITNYRPEVDGLRAVAVLAVIANHVWSDLLPGGFLGVDMFFVISGFVITSSMSSHAHRTFQEVFLDFYARRVKRLIPALVVCVLVTSLLGLLFIPHDNPELRFSLNAGAASLFGMSNLYFYSQARDYFGGSTELNLFTHTWSLGVEEQFYLLFPALLWMSGRASGESRQQAFFLAILGVLSALSFFVYLRFFTASNYYMMPPRFWELGVGCLVSVFSRYAYRDEPAAPGLLPAFSFLFLALIVLSLGAPAQMRLYTTPLVVASTALLIVAIRPEHWVFRLLAQRYIVLIGLVSYSLYLWHWSVLALSRWTVGLGPYTAPFQLAAMVGLAVASYLLVERPLRRASWSSSRIATIGIAAGAIASAAFIVLAMRNEAFSRFYTGAPVQMAARGTESLQDDKWDSGVRIWQMGACVLASNEDVGKQIDAEQCSFGRQNGAKRRFLVIGNSFGAAEFEMFAKLPDERLGSVTFVPSWDSSPVPEVPKVSPRSKSIFYYWQSVVPKLLSSLSAGDVVVMLFDIQELAPPEMTEDARRSLDLLQAGLDRLSRELQEKGVQIVFQASLPFIRDANCTPDNAVPQWYNLGHPTACTLYSRTDTTARRRPLIDVLRKVEREYRNFHVFDPFDIFCPAEICGFFTTDNIPLYRDSWSHPSIEASLLMKPAFVAVVTQALAYDESSATKLR